MRKRLSSLPVLVALAVVVAAGVGIALGLTGSGGGSDEPPPLDLPAAGDTTPSDPGEDQAGKPQSARQVFGHSCGTCHTLADAGTTARVGPDLDVLKPSAGQVRRMIRTGSIDGVMQPNLLRGEDARRVAAYVARVAGRG